MRLITALLALLLLLAACGGAATSTPAANGGGGTEATPAPDGGGNTGGGDDACLNTNEEVSAAMGVEVTVAENTATPGGGGSCIYYIDKETFDIAYTIGLSAGGGVGQQVFDAFKNDEAAEPASGIGDEAIFYAGGLVIRKGDRVLSIGVAPSDDRDDAEVRSILEDLGPRAADRL